MQYALWSLFALALGAVASAIPLIEVENSESLSKRATVLDCLTQRNVPIRLISSSDFAQRSKTYNLRQQWTPAVIVLPTTIQHIQDAVVCAGQNGVKVQAKSGGHSYASFSSGGQNGSMMIDLENFQEITVNAQNFIAKVGPGVRLGNLALSIYSQHKRALSHGTCPAVGLGGHATHGGYGLVARAWGLTLDAITAMNVVLANGSSIHTTPTSYPDIYYALRGAADSFGIVTSFYLATKPAPTTITTWSFLLSDMFSSAAKTADVFLNLQKFVLNPAIVDRKLTFRVWFDGDIFRVNGIYLGSVDTFNNKIKPELLRGLPTPSPLNLDARPVDWIQNLREHVAGANDLEQPLTGYDLHDTFYAKSIVTPESAPLTKAAMTSFFDYVIKNGAKVKALKGSWVSIINLYGGPDSQINVPSASSSAYAHRSGLWVFHNLARGNSSEAPFPATITNFVNGMNNALISAQPETTFDAYLNYVDPDLTAAQAHSLYYGSPTYERLAAIKKTVDPKQVFWNPQAIGN